MENGTGKKSVKSRIVSAAWQLFYEKGYNGTTVDEIIELSGTSKGSFYYYFDTKDELLNTLSVGRRRPEAAFRPEPSLL